MRPTCAVCKRLARNKGNGRFAKYCSHHRSAWMREPEADTCNVDHCTLKRYKTKRTCLNHCEPSYREHEKAQLRSTARRWYTRYRWGQCKVYTPSDSIHWKDGDQPCWLCNWSLTICDKHRIIPGRLQGTYCKENVIIVCPNCHRWLHDRGPDAADIIRGAAERGYPVAKHMKDIEGTLIALPDVFSAARPLT